MDARRLFDALGSGRTAASWTSMIAGYARWGQERTGLRLFKTMLKVWISPTLRKSSMLRCFVQFPVIVMCLVKTG